MSGSAMVNRREKITLILSTGVLPLGLVLACSFEQGKMLAL